MRKIVFAFAVLILVVLPLLAQQASPTTKSPAPASGAPAAGPVHSNITYGVAGGETLLLDVFEPANNTGQPRPAIVLVHGGGWTGFDKSTMQPLARFLALAGFVAVPVNYRLFHDDATRWPALGAREFREI
jgi:acetyl esterase/lipase